MKVKTICTCLVIIAILGYAESSDHNLMVESDSQIDNEALIGNVPESDQRNYDLAMNDMESDFLRDANSLYAGRVSRSSYNIKYVSRLEYEMESKRRQIDHLQTAVVRQKLTTRLIFFTALPLLVMIMLIGVYLFKMRQGVQMKCVSVEKEKECVEETLSLRNKELTSETMHSARFSDVCTEAIKNVDSRFRDVDKCVKSEIKKMLAELQNEAHDRDYWQDFEKRFIEVHPDFYERLLARSSNLTATEIKICALLRLSMNTKDIAHLTSRSVRTVESTRFAIRKKLGLDKSMQLIPWLIAV
ncbi:hypothetical protein KAR48_02645 [bacterium]|nr:hypothetical protein [bacterium]